uniref:Uncharacterized protein n=1 Tax=Cyclophora tenuis TaxID=216820 RepID=A0A7S1D0M4_CYCTE|mmetsp:Transcript_16319/g.27657  ORF Transcript_16319/g.27657 Transcript_16319/m.27657 type:complete len:121 (+) Transcript_16319:714-1076(+)
MAQGSGKLAKAKKSGGAQKRKVVRGKKKPSKGRKYHAPKGRKAASQSADLETTKAINRKNEALLSAKAVGDGTRFFLSDVKETGKKELNAQLKARSKKEDKATRMCDRVKEQLRKMGREV